MNSSINAYYDVVSAHRYDLKLRDIFSIRYTCETRTVTSISSF
nr:ALPV-002 [Albatrosspox virus]UNS14522.1 ALPV-358 [Albatrosspox virus]